MTMIIFQSMFTPVLTEYDNVIAQLQQKISSYQVSTCIIVCYIAVIYMTISPLTPQTELASLNSRVEQITTENGR